MAVLVTIPGIMSDARTWAPLARDLESQVDGVHVADTTQDATLETMAARALRDTQGDLIVVAHSMGGRVAMEMGRQAPERIKAMILSSTSAEGPSASERAHREARIKEANADMADYAMNWAQGLVKAERRKRGPGCTHPADGRGLRRGSARAPESRAAESTRCDNLYRGLSLSGSSDYWGRGSHFDRSGTRCHRRNDTGFQVGGSSRGRSPVAV